MAEMTPVSLSQTYSQTYSQTWTFFEGAWHEGNIPIMGPRTHAAWLGSTVFDGARSFEGVAPDLEAHCARVNQSAINFKLKPVVDTDTWLDLAREGIARFDADAELYIRPMYWAQSPSAAPSRCRRSAGRPWKTRRWIARPRVFTRTIRAR